MWSYRGGVGFQSYERIGHLAVAAQLRDAVLSGEYRPGSRLPSEGFLAVEFGCGRDTIRDAFAVLRRELLLVTERDAERWWHLPRTGARCC
jgi:DNA-binding FadR family transcriptional regulator